VAFAAAAAAAAAAVAPPADDRRRWLEAEEEAVVGRGGVAAAAAAVAAATAAMCSAGTGVEGEPCGEVTLPGDGGRRGAIAGAGDACAGDNACGGDVSVPHASASSSATTTMAPSAGVGVGVDANGVATVAAGVGVGVVVVRATAAGAAAVATGAAAVTRAGDGRKPPAPAADPRGVVVAAGPEVGPVEENEDDRPPARRAGAPARRDAPLSAMAPPLFETRVDRSATGQQSGW